MNVRVSGGPFLTLNPFAYGHRLTGGTRVYKKSLSVSSQMGGGVKIVADCCEDRRIHKYTL